MTTLTHDYRQQFAFARRRCPECDYWPAACLGPVKRACQSGKLGRHRGQIVGYNYQCRVCGSLQVYWLHKKLLRWAFQLAYYSILFDNVKRRVRTEARRLMALHALRDNVSEVTLREKIVRMAGLW